MMIRIGSKRYRQLVVDKIPDAHGHVVGRIWYGYKLIYIRRKTLTGKPRSERKMKATLWHECVHGILEDMGSPKERDERFVTELAKRIQQVGAQIGF